MEIASGNGTEPEPCHQPCHRVFFLINKEIFLRRHLSQLIFLYFPRTHLILFNISLLFYLRIRLKLQIL
jgi:hypothetical protein